MSNFSAIIVLTPQIQMNSQTSLSTPQGPGLLGSIELMGITKQMQIPWETIQGPRGKCRQCYRNISAGAEVQRAWWEIAKVFIKDCGLLFNFSQQFNVSPTHRTPRIKHTTFPSVKSNSISSKAMQLGRQNKSPQRCPCLNPQNLWLCHPYVMKGTLQMWLRFKTLRQGRIS